MLRNLDKWIYVVFILLAFLKWADTMEKNFMGRIVQVKITCNYPASASRPPRTACLIFKTSGQITCECVFLEIFKNTVIFNRGVKCMKSVESLYFKI